VKSDEKKQFKNLAGPSGVPHLDKFRILQLNADGQPLSYFPLSTITWRQAMFLIVKQMTTGIPRLNVLEEYDDPNAIVHAGRMDFVIPSVVQHLEMIEPPRRVPFTKFNVFLRDDFTCQYTGRRFSPRDLTWDHVFPQSRGGKGSWENIATCWNVINEAKDDKLLNQDGSIKLTYKDDDGITITKTHRLLRQPYVPGAHELRQKGRKYPPKYLHESWQDYLYWDTELEP
jgi:5-methylcytosine-specific restriction endonuclease McrA